MLLKLLKYDFRAMWKHLSLIWGAALALALINRMTHSMGFMFRAHDFSGNISGFTSAILIAVFVAMFVISLIFVLQRFYKGLLGNEGYLMHTLPVRPWQLVLSKLICAIVTYVLSGATAILSILLMITTDWWNFFFDFPLWSDLVQGVVKHPGIIPLILEFCLIFLSAIIQSISVFYLAIALGHLFSRRRVLASVVAYIALYILLNNVLARLFDWDLFQLLMDAATSNVHGALLAYSATLLVPAAIFLAAVCWILGNKLNLE